MGHNTRNYTEQGGDRTVIGGEIDIVNGGELKFNGTPASPAAYQANSVAVDTAGLVADFNALLFKLKEAGLMRNE